MANPKISYFAGHRKSLLPQNQSAGTVLREHSVTPVLAAGNVDVPENGT